MHLLGMVPDPKVDPGPLNHPKPLEDFLNRTFHLPRQIPHKVEKRGALDPYPFLFLKGFLISEMSCTKIVHRPRPSLSKEKENSEVMLPLQADCSRSTAAADGATKAIYTHK